jgi:hypothetical protein
MGFEPIHGTIRHDRRRYVMKKILSLQKLSMDTISNGGGSRLSVTGCPGASSLSLITCD